MTNMILNKRLYTNILFCTLSIGLPSLAFAQDNPYGGEQNHSQESSNISDTPSRLAAPSSYPVNDGDHGHPSSDKLAAPEVSPSHDKYAYYSAPAKLSLPEKEDFYALRYWNTFVASSLTRRDPETTKKDKFSYSLYQRINADFQYTFGDFLVKLSGDILTGELYVLDHLRYPKNFPDRAYSGTYPRRNAFTDWQNWVQPHNAYIQYNSPIGVFQLGLQTSRFGIGIVSNGADPNPDTEPLFGEKYGADRSLRLRFATKPLAFIDLDFFQKLIFFIAGDLVYRDDNADLLAGDLAGQLSVALYYRDLDLLYPKNDTFVGFNFGRRWQKDHDGNILNAFAYDFAGFYRFGTPSNRWHFNLGFELSALTGSTNRALPQNYPYTKNEDTKISGLGAAFELSARYNPAYLAAEILTGYASGDANSDDDTLYRYRFDGNYDVGLVLFQDVLPRLSRLSYERATDPAHAGNSPKGVEGLINDGAVENAIYLNPRLYFGEPDSLLGGIGLLWAIADKPFSDPYNSFKNGGTLTNHNGEPASKNLGIELDAALRYTATLYDRLRLQTKLEGGILFPGKALSPIGSPYLVRVRIGLLW